MTVAAMHALGGTAFVEDSSRARLAGKLRGLVGVNYTRIDKRQPRTNEIKVEPGRRQHWTLLLAQSQVQVEAILNNLGVP
jgi:hypothetical protein